MKSEVDNHDGSLETPTNEEPKNKGWKNILERVGKLMAAHTHKEDKWLDQMRGNLSLVATVIATMTFQMALNPPGGVKSIKDEVKPPLFYDVIDPRYVFCPISGTNSSIWLCPGKAVLALIYPHDYFRFLVSNTICFVSSLGICLLLVSGIPLNHRFPIWLLLLGMSVTLTSLTISYITALSMTTRDPIFDKANKFLTKLIDTWIGLLSVIALWYTLRFVIWGVKLFNKRNKKAMTQTITNEETHVNC